MACSSIIPWGKGAARGSQKEFIQFLHIVYPVQLRGTRVFHGAWVSVRG